MSETTTRTEARKLAKTVESVLQSNAEAERYNVLTDVLEMVLEDAEARGAQRERERIEAICDEQETQAEVLSAKEHGHYNDARYYDGCAAVAALIRDAVQP
jgi:hypothetical protein